MLLQDGENLIEQLRQTRIRLFTGGKPGRMQPGHFAGDANR